MDHPVRRRVIALLMLLGSVGLVGAASSAILGFRGAASGAERWRLVELTGGLLALVFISRSRWVDRRLTAAIGYVLRRHTDVAARDVAGLLQLSGDYAVHEFAVNACDWLADRSLGELGLRDEGVVVLAITRTDGTFLAAPDGGTVIRPGDNLVLYGTSSRLRELDRRPAGASGALAHYEAVEEHERVKLDERQREKRDEGLVG